MSLRLFVVRHAESEYTRERRFTGWSDVPLSPEGRRQCAALAQALDGLGAQAVYASPLQRARATAEAIAGVRGLPVRLDAAFREMGFGDWEGVTVREVAEKFPEDFALWRSAPARVHRPGGERLAEVAARVGAGRDALRAAHPEGTLVLVTHAVVARLLVLDALGLGPERLWTVDATPAGISELEYRDDWVTVHRMNTLAHLTPSGAPA
jgi:ribonuclease H / adenosylcobalamin/alpha-ribazole phosphatase